MSPTARRCVCLVLVLGSVLAMRGAAQAGGSTTSIFGGRRMGMLANMGAPDDLAALFHNPAGLADQKGWQVMVFVSPAFLSSDFRMQALDEGLFPNVNPRGCETAPDGCPWTIDHEGYYTREIQPEKYFGVIPYLGVSADLGQYSRRLKDVTVSASIYSPNFYGAFLPENAPTAYYVVGGFFLVGSATVGAGWRINDYVSVGASLSYNYMHLILDQKISLVQALTKPGEPPNAMASAANNLLGDLTMNYAGTDHGMGWGAGVLVHPVPWIGIGIGYLGYTPSEFKGPVEMEVESENVEDEQQLRDLFRVFGYKLPRELVLKMPLPHSIAMGVNVALGRQVELGVDLRLWFYQFYKKQELIPIYDESEKGQKPMTAESMSRDKDYTMSWQLAGGMLVRPFRGYLGLEVMGGVGIDISPVPDHTFSLDNPNLSHLKFTLGLRWRITEAWRVSLGYLLNLYLPRDVRNSETSPPTNVQVESHSHSPSIDITFAF